MNGVGRPFRFLALVLGGWIVMRVIMVWPWTQEIVEMADSAGKMVVAPVVAAEVASPTRLTGAAQPPDLTIRPARMRVAGVPASFVRDVVPMAQSIVQTATRSVPMHASPGSPIGNPPAAGSRWSASAWLIARGTGSAALAPGGTLGGSQAGVRVTWRPVADMPIAMFGRVSRPLQTSGAEAAIGIEARPFADLPVRLALEQRFALERGAAAGTAASVIGGVSDVALPGGFKLDGYGQAGVIGLRRREAFVDGSASILRPVISFDDTDILLGAGIWGAAQPGLSRLDIGPRAELRLPVASQRVRLGLEWRERVVGNAHPGSGPTLTIGTDF